ncbi:alpha/beta hydrolase [Blastococcus sp. CCUG 61487]|uniref:alpha/beta fold hydrolase n=1 Tax=Blastococcus sp. CCUG 61487 TaxID=1840703 RepID=UPI0010C0DFBF|nr:alpha/beta hydrolase [Blastococcus sp. CCUG 61487]TKJ18109.1 alpha/beta hydrolase [Blastococcus sp. CCUG 61487]
MRTFDAPDGTTLAYRRTGDGDPLVVLPGGPMRAADYLGDLGGGLRRSLVLLDLRGTGGSAVPADPATYRCDAQVDDVEALQVHLGLDRLDLVAHSAGATLAVLYARRHPERVGRLVLVGPSAQVAGVTVSDDDRRAVAEQRRDEPWFPDAFAALERIQAGEPTEADWDASAPFNYGRWDDAARALSAADAHQRNQDARARYHAPGAFDAADVRAGLTRLRVPVLLLTGEYDMVIPPNRAAEFAALFPDAALTVQPRAGHYPWLDDAAAFAGAVTAFLDRTTPPRSA